MKRKVIICSVKNNTVKTAYVESTLRDSVDYASEIELCREQLASTDYVVIKIAEGAATREEYAEVIAERRALRARIAELEQKQRQRDA